MSQRTKIRLTTIALLILAVFTVFLDFPGQLKNWGVPVPQFLDKPFRLGLDLQGGTHLIYEADLSQIPAEDHESAVEGVRDVIERRVNSFGVAEPVVQTTQTNNSYRIIVELAGVHDVNEAIMMIGETPLLEFKEVNPNPVVSLTEEQQTELDDFNTISRQKAEKLLAKVQEPGADFTAIANESSEDPGNLNNGGDLGMLPRGLLVPEFETVCFDELEVGQISDKLTETMFGYHIITKTNEQGEGDEYQAQCSHILTSKKSEADYVDPNNEWLYTGLTGKQLERAYVEFDPYTQVPQVSLEFNQEGTNMFAEITERNIGRPVAIFLDGEPISIPTVQQSITAGRASISGQFSIAEAKLLSQRLNAGALPVPINLISQQTVGATLGNKSIEKSVKAGIIGLIIVGIFMIIYYRLPGLVAVLSLLFYGLLVLSIFKAIPVTMTLSGIAGFILSLGMAVDANVLIFERLKEEYKDERPLEHAIKNSFTKAWPAIFDGNISTLITCFILMGFTTSMVKGFAITLSIGILVSMFSAMIVTKNILTVLFRTKILSAPWLYGVKR